MPSQPSYTVVYDGTCGVCQRAVGTLQRWDKGRVLEIVASQEPGVPARFPWIPSQAYAESIQVIGPDRQTWQGAAAMEELLRVLPKGRWFSWVFALPFARPLAERFYRWFARNRYKLGCGAHCQVHPPGTSPQEPQK